MVMLKHDMNFSDFIMPFQRNRFLTVGFWEGIIIGHGFFGGAGLAGHVNNFGKDRSFTEC